MCVNLRFLFSGKTVNNNKNDTNNYINNNNNYVNLCPFSALSIAFDITSSNRNFRCRRRRRCLLYCVPS